MRTTSMIMLVGSLFLLASAGCKGGQGEGPSEERGEGPGGDGPGERGPEGDDDGEPMPWPPPGATKAPPPPQVTELMEKMAHAWNAKDGETARKLFIKRTTFLVVSDCDPADVVDRVMDGAKQAAERAAQSGPVKFAGFGDGYFIDVKEGEKPAECRAKRPVKLYLAKYKWDRGGRVQDGEAHFLEFNGVWFFVKL